MALLKCPICGGKVSTLASSCPHCKTSIERILSLPFTRGDSNFNIESSGQHNTVVSVSPRNEHNHETWNNKQPDNWWLSLFQSEPPEKNEESVVFQENELLRSAGGNIAFKSLVDDDYEEECEPDPVEEHDEDDLFFLDLNYEIDQMFFEDFLGGDLSRFVDVIYERQFSDFDLDYMELLSDYIEWLHDFWLYVKDFI